MPFRPEKHRPLGYKTPQERKADHDKTRGTAAQRGYNYKWQKARKGWLTKHPLCEECKKQGFTTAATDVDHIIPHRGCQKLFWDSENNWQSLCGTCHKRKTARGE